MRRIVTIVPVMIGLSACGGGGGTGGGGFTGGGGETVAPFISSLSTQTLAVNEDRDIGAIRTQIDFDDEDSGTITIAGTTPVPFTRRSGSNTYLSNNGSVVFTIFEDLPGGIDLEDAYFVEGLDGRLRDNILFAYADGESAIAGRSGTAVYRGTVTARGSNGMRYNGTVRINADFDDPVNGITGRIVGGFPNEPDARFILEPADIRTVNVPGDPRTFIRQFDTTLTSPDVTVTDSRLLGEFFGGRAIDEVGGQYNIQANGRAVIGLFGAAE